MTGLGHCVQEPSWQLCWPILAPPGPCQANPSPPRAPTTLSPSPWGGARAGQTEGHTDAGLGLRTPSWGCGPGGQLLFLASGDLALTPGSGQQEGSLVGAGRCPGEAPTLRPPRPRSTSSTAVSAQALPDLSPEPTPLGVSSSIAAGFRIFHIFHLRALPPHHPRWMLSSERVSTREARPCRGVCFLFGAAGICSSCVNPEVVMSPVRKHSCGFLACALVLGPPATPLVPTPGRIWGYHGS